MAFSLFSKDNKISYGINNWVADTKDDLPLIPKCEQGSMVFIIDESKFYILNSQKKWIEKESASGGIEPTGSINITENGNNIDVTTYATANVQVPVGIFPEGTIGLTDPLLTYDVANYANAYINIPTVEESEW